MPSEVKVSVKKPVGAYVKAVQVALQGLGEASPEDQVTISAAGNAINAAAIVASRAEKNGWATIEKIETSYAEVSSGKQCAHLLIVLQNHADHEELKEHTDLGAALQHQDALSRMTAVFCGALKYGSRARSEIFEEAMQQGEGRNEKRERFRSAVHKVKMLASQTGFLEENKKTQDDHQFLMVKVEGWLEVLDPKHRYGGNLKFYYPKWRDSDTHQSFFEWLDEGEGKGLDLDACSRETLDTQLVKYLTIIERESYVVKPSNGRLLYEQSGEALEGKLIFVMSVRGLFYAGKKVKGRFHHSSFLGGGGVLVAGAAEFKDGLFTSLTPHSGHYHPKPGDFEKFVSYLKDAGLDPVNVDLLNSWSHDDGFGRKRAEEDK